MSLKIAALRIGYDPGKDAAYYLDRMQALSTAERLAFSCRYDNGKSFIGNFEFFFFFSVVATYFANNQRVNERNPF